MNTLRHAAIVLGTLIALSAQAHKHTDQDPAAPDSSAGQHQRHEQPRSDDRRSSPAEQPETLDGDQVPEGQHGDSHDPQAPGGEHGDGRTDPGMLE